MPELAHARAEWLPGEVRDPGRQAAPSELCLTDLLIAIASGMGSPSPPDAALLNGRRNLLRELIHSSRFVLVGRAGVGLKVGVAIRRQTVLVAAALFALLALAAPPPAHAQQPPAHNAVIFIHGYSGSGAQFESQKLRFVENGYPQSYVRVLDYDSLPATPVPGATGLNPAGIRVIEQELFPRLDQLVADLKAETGRPQVDLTAHSLGTTLMHDYLNSDPARAANIAHYVNLDGRTAATPPGGVPTLALWGSKGPLSPPNRSITGATNVTIPDATHVQVATSPVSFGEMYKFFNGGPPATTDIVPEKGKITLAGKALSFPDNNGMPGAVVQVWSIDNATGQRTSTT